VSKTGIARLREKNLELGHDMVYGVRTENERVNKVVDFNAQRDASVADNSMVHFPKWKSDEKDKFVSVVRPFHPETVQCCDQQLFARQTESWMEDRPVQRDREGRP
jgi:hypothetical protein